MIKAQDFTIVVSYRDVINEAGANVKHEGLRFNAILLEYRKLLKSLSNNKSRSNIEIVLLATKSFKAKELMEINTVRKLMASINTLSKEQLRARYPEGAFNPHVDQTGIMANYNRGSQRHHDRVSIGGKIIGRGRNKPRIATNN